MAPQPLISSNHSNILIFLSILFPEIEKECGLAATTSVAAAQADDLLNNLLKI
jgi:hypothetical protein